MLKVYSYPLQSLRFTYTFTGSVGAWNTPTNSLRLNEWHYIAVIYNRSSSANDPQVYIDGVVQNLTGGSSPSGDPSSNAASNLSIGNFDTTGPRTFNGLIDDVRIYNRALSPDEIKRLYITGAAGKLGVAANNDSLAQGLVGYWTFDGKDMAGAMGITSARTAYDRSGNGNNGKYWNATNTPAVNGKLGQALEFDGSNNYVNISDPANGSLDFGSGSFSISA